MPEAYLNKTTVGLAMRASIDFFIDVFSSMQVFENILLFSSIKVGKNGTLLFHSVLINGDKAT